MSSRAMSMASEPSCRSRPEGDSRRFKFQVPDGLAKFIAPKGSIAIDGTSLTVNEVARNRFGVNIIPHTQAVTTWGQAKAGRYRQH